MEVTFIRLVDGELPEYPIRVTERPLDYALFDNVLLARAPHLLERVPDGLKRRDVEKQLRLWAELLRTAAPDFVAGSDAAMIDAERVVRERVAMNPQVVTVWLPADATDEREERAREDAERRTPPEVDVVVRRYSR